MNELLLFLKNSEVWVYTILGLVGLIYARKFFVSFSEYRRALFGLEKDNARGKVSESASMLILVTVIAVGEFMLASFLVPSYPGIQPLPTSTLDVLATPLASLQVSAAIAADGTPVPTTTAVLGTNCPAGQLEFTNPLPGGEVKGKVVLKGTISVADFGFYKYQFAPAASEDWVTIAAGNIAVVDGELGPWDTSLYMPGDYQLRLIVTDHQGLETTPCIIPIRIIAP
jgi:hypothetical protein